MSEGNAQVEHKIVGKQWISSKATASLRWYNGVLQQRYIIDTYSGVGSTDRYSFEWRDVPVIDEPEEEV